MTEDKRLKASTAACLLLVTLLAGFLVAARPSPAGEPMTAETKIRQLNDQYIEAFLKADVSWYQKHLSDDFVCITSSGTVLNKQQFLEDTATGPDGADYKLEDVRVRIHGNAALVQGLGAFARKDGTHGKSRYIDVYVRDGKEWKAVSAQITRIAEPKQ